MTKSPVARLRNERGVTTAEYAVVTAAGCGFASDPDQAAHQRLGPEAPQDAVRAYHEGRRALTVAVEAGGGGGGRAGRRGPAPSAQVAGRRAGAVTAETAMVLPMLVAVALGLAWLVALAATQVRVVDAAREAARAVARDDEPGHARSAWAGGSHRRRRISVHHGADRVVVRSGPRCAARVACWRFLPGRAGAAEAVAAQEPR